MIVGINRGRLLKLLRVSYFPLEMVSDCISHLGCLVDVLLEVEHTIKKR